MSEPSPPTPPTPLPFAEALTRLTDLPGWTMHDLATIGKTYTFGDFYRTIAFVNAVAYVAHTLDHHPDLEVTCVRCTVRFTSHDAGGLTPRDFAAAGAVERLAREDVA